MTTEKTTRRSFMRGGVVLTGGHWLRISSPALVGLSQAACSAARTSSPFKILRTAEAIEFEAIAARILPETTTPGAREAGVIWFFDQTFGSFNTQILATARAGLAQFQAAIGSTKAFSELDEQAQDNHLGKQQNTVFFDMMQYMTVSGFFGMGQYGGNRDDIGWKLIDVDPHQHAFLSPFGYYDAEHIKVHSSD